MCVCVCVCVLCVCDYMLILHQYVKNTTTGERKRKELRR